jgi:hypothetical protein
MKTYRGGDVTAYTGKCIVSSQDFDIMENHQFQWKIFKAFSLHDVILNVPTQLQQMELN